MKIALRLITIFTLASALAVHAQDKPRDEAYKLSFAIYEMEDGKKINQRDYILLTKTNASDTSINNLRMSNLKMGTRVPVNYEEKKVTYMDVGLELRCGLKDTNEDRLLAQFEIELSSFALPEQATNSAGGGNPVVRRINTGVLTYMKPGKPVVIASIDDMNSKKRTVIEVTATKIE